VAAQQRVSSSFKQRQQRICEICSFRGGAYVSVPVTPEHVELWNEFWPPVVLTLWDEASDVTYWECIHSAVAIAPQRRQRPGATRIWIPITNILDGRGIQRLLARTENRFLRHERERQGAEHLIAVLRDNLGLEIVYDPQFGVLEVPEGLFIPTPGAGPRIYPFGRFAKELAALARALGVSTEEAFNIAVGSQLGMLQRILRGEPVIIRSPTGEILTEWHTPADVRDDYIRLLEEDDGP
jgi:hypothetical protein